jgi:hypothetical protein
MANHKKEKLPPKWEFFAGGVLCMLLISVSIGVLADDLGKDGREITLEEAASAGDVKEIQRLLTRRPMLTNKMKMVLLLSTRPQAQVV